MLPWVEQSGGQADGGPGGWIILDEPELHIGADVLVPDLAGWRRTRMPEMPDTPAFELAPDWVCEILSPSTGARDRADKMPIYARHGVAHLWLVDPALQTVEVYRRSPATPSEGAPDNAPDNSPGTSPGNSIDRWLAIRTFAGDVKVRAEPFDAIELDLSRLWAR